MAAVLACAVLGLGLAVVSPAYANFDKPPIFVSGITPGEVDPDPPDFFDPAARIALSDEGSLFMCGTVWHAASGDDVVVQRLDDDPLGWTRTWSGSADRDEWAQDIAVFANGPVYVCGMVETGRYARSLFLLKYSADGTLLWEKLWDYLNMSAKIKLDRGGDIYVYGLREWDDGDRIVLAKYRPDGTRAWWRQYGTTRGDLSRSGVGDLYVDSQGTSYLAGYDGARSLDDRALLLSYTAGGRKRWTRIYGGAGRTDSHFTALARCRAGGVFACGNASSNASGLPGASDLLVTRYTAAGERVLTKRFGVGDGRAQWVTDAALAKLGRVALCGYWQKPGGGFYVALLRPDGTVRWSHNYPGGPAEALVVDSSDRVCATGEGVRAPLGLNGPVATYAFSNSGGLRWQSIWPAPAAYDLAPQDIAAWQSSNVWVSGWSDRSLTGFDQFVLGWGL
jgi:hypothetical protein